MTAYDGVSLAVLTFGFGVIVGQDAESSFGAFLFYLSMIIGFIMTAIGLFYHETGTYIIH